MLREILVQYGDRETTSRNFFTSDASLSNRFDPTSYVQVALFLVKSERYFEILSPLGWKIIPIPDILFRLFQESGKRIAKRFIPPSYRSNNTDSTS